MNELNQTTGKDQKADSCKIFIEVEEIMKMTGKSKPTCYRYMKKIKDFFDKKPHQKITLIELQEYLGVD